MTEWWTVQQSALIGSIGGSAVGILGGTFGALIGILGSKGRAKRFVLTTSVLFFLVGACSLIAGLVAVLAGQPYHVYYFLLLCGGIIVLTMGPLFPVIFMRYREAEKRRMEAESLRRA